MEELLKRKEGEKRRRRRFVPLSIFPHFGGSLCIKRTLIEQSGFIYGKYLVCVQTRCKNIWCKYKVSKPHSNGGGYFEEGV